MMMSATEARSTRKKTGPARTLRPRTLMVRGGTKRSANSGTSEAIYMNAGYVYGSAADAETAFIKDDGSRFLYSRYASPTVNMFEERLRLVEGAEGCRSTSSGMAAVFAALLCQLRAGDRVVASRALFGSCHYIIAQLLPRYGIETVFVDGRDLAAWRQALERGAKAGVFASPSHPTLELVDLEAGAALAPQP